MSNSSTPSHGVDYQSLFDRILRRYGHPDPEGLAAVLTPVLIPVKSIGSKIESLKNHFRTSFKADIVPEAEHLMVRGQTGKFVPRAYAEGDADGIWNEKAKGRVVNVDRSAGVVEGEVYRSRKMDLEEEIQDLTADDYLEVDQYGAAAKILSGLVEHHFLKDARDSGYTVRRMPEDMAKHLGDYHNYDFEITKGGETQRVEVKSLWGTNTDYARLIHSKSKGYKTSSCKFKTQEIFAVSRFLRTGDVSDFAYAKSVSEEDQPHGLPTSSNYPGYVNQNPRCEIGDGRWFESIDEVWNLPK